MKVRRLAMTVTTEYQHAALITSHEPTSSLIVLGAMLYMQAGMRISGASLCLPAGMCVLCACLRSGHAAVSHVCW